MHENEELSRSIAKIYAIAHRCTTVQQGCRWMGLNPSHQEHKTVITLRGRSIISMFCQKSRVISVWPKSFIRSLYLLLKGTRKTIALCRKVRNCKTTVYFSEFQTSRARLLSSASWMNRADRAKIRNTTPPIRVTVI